MTGLLLIAVAIVWVAAVVVITRWTTRLFRPVAMKVVSALVVFPALLLAPLADELIGGWQFEALCKRYATQTIDEEHAKNGRVFYERRTADRFAEGTFVRIRIDPVVYREVDTNRVVVSYHSLHANGGWLIRTLGISETNAPLLFRSACAPPNEDEFKKKFNITVIN